MNTIKCILITMLICTSIFGSCQERNTDPLNAKIITSDLTNFCEAYDLSAPIFDPEIFQKFYLDKKSKGLTGFIKNRIVSAEYLTAEMNKRPLYYQSIRQNLNGFNGNKESFISIFVKLKEVYPKATFPPVYFVVGAMNSGGTTSRNGLIIGFEMYGMTDQTYLGEVSDWHKEVLKSVDEIPTIVAHEIIHVQQPNNIFKLSLLEACLREGIADFIAQLICGHHINIHVHEYANPKEQELWNEFKAIMDESDYTGWLYSSTDNRPNDLGYWMGYKIAEAYYKKSKDKLKAIDDMINVKNGRRFLEASHYADKFN